MSDPCGSMCHGTAAGSSRGAVGRIRHVRDSHPAAPHRQTSGTAPPRGTRRPARGRGHRRGALPRGCRLDPGRIPRCRRVLRPLRLPDHLAAAGRARPHRPDRLQELLHPPGPPAAARPVRRARRDRPAGRDGRLRRRGRVPPRPPGCAVLLLELAEHLHRDLVLRVHRPPAHAQAPVVAGGGGAVLHLLARDRPVRLPLARGARRGARGPRRGAALDAGDDHRLVRRRHARGRRSEPPLLRHRHARDGRLRRRRPGGRLAPGSHLAGPAPAGSDGDHRGRRGRPAPAGAHVHQARGVLDLPLPRRVPRRGPRLGRGRGCGQPPGCAVRHLAGHAADALGR